jgi:hypothetical protein
VEKYSEDETMSIILIATGKCLTKHGIETHCGEEHDGGSLGTKMPEAATTKDQRYPRHT